MCVCFKVQTTGYGSCNNHLLFGRYLKMTKEEETKTEITGLTMICVDCNFILDTWMISFFYVC